MRGVFIVVGVGIVGGLALIVIEIAYKKHQIRRNKRNEVTRMAFMKWRGNVEKSRLRSTFLGGGENYVNPHGNGLGNLRSLSDGDFKGTARDITPDSMTTLSVDTLRENSNCKMRISSGWRDDQGFNTTLIPDDDDDDVIHPLKGRSVPTTPNRRENLSDELLMMSDPLSYHPTTTTTVMRRSCGAMNEVSIEAPNGPLPPTPTSRNQFRQGAVATAGHIYLHHGCSGGIPARSPSSSDSSRKKHAITVMTGGGVGKQRKKPKRLWPPKSEQTTFSNREYSDLRQRFGSGGGVLPNPPPPPKQYLQQIPSPPPPPAQLAVRINKNQPACYSHRHRPHHQQYQEQQQQRRPQSRGSRHHLPDYDIDV